MVLSGLELLLQWFFVSQLLLSLCSSDDENSQGPGSLRFDFGSLATATLFLGICSAEGVPQLYSFESANISRASHYVDTSPTNVWRALEQATSPAFPLPSILHAIPIPVDVTIDEGTQLGSIRKVAFEGREGSGYLTMHVVERTQNRVVFEVLSDTSPIAAWVAHRKLIYQVAPEKNGTRLSVHLEYDRLLAPAWFFSPMTRGAAYLAMDVLARDVKARAEL